MTVIRREDYALVTRLVETGKNVPTYADLFRSMTDDELARRINFTFRFRNTRPQNRTELVFRLAVLY